ncbi:MAG: GNAT family N-acetyltransferase [Nitrososphaerales archaeon]
MIEQAKRKINGGRRRSSDSQGYQFRRAGPSDATQVVALLHQMFTTPPHGFDERNTLRTVRKFSTEKSVFHLVVERNGGSLIASMVGYFIEYARFGRRMLVEDFVVDKRFRGIGLGTQMLEYMKKVAAKNGCTGIVLHTGRHNTVAQRFYSAKGMEENVMFKLDLLEISK